MNPARSLGPALMSATWTAQWIYLTAPFLGAALAALTYRWLRLSSSRLAPTTHRPHVIEQGAR
jgi:hypothetical protein